MKRIVVGTDLGPRSKGAVEMAAQLAEATGATLHLTYACPPAPAAPMPEVTMPDMRDALKGADQELNAMASDLRRRGVATEIHSCISSAADALCRVAETVEADCIVVGNKRMQGKGRLLGSVPNKVAHHAPCSVLIARTG